jgi:hypothetical protein
MAVYIVDILEAVQIDREDDDARRVVAASRNKVA